MIPFFCRVPANELTAAPFGTVTITWAPSGPDGLAS